MRLRLPEATNIKEEISRNYLITLVKALHASFAALPEPDDICTDCMTTAEVCAIVEDYNYTTCAEVCAIVENFDFVVSSEKTTFDSQFFDTSGPHTVALTAPIILANANVSTVHLVFPSAGAAVGKVFFIKRTDTNHPTNTVVLTEASNTGSGTGFDANVSVPMGSQAGFIVYSNGANWWIMSDR